MSQCIAKALNELGFPGEVEGLVAKPEPFYFLILDI